MLQGIRKGKDPAAAFAGALDFARRAGPLFFFLLPGETLLAVLAVIRNMFPGGIDGEAFAASLADALHLFGPRGLRLRRRHRGGGLFSEECFQFFQQFLNKYQQYIS